MDDGKYLFISDVKERKTIARNSRYKKNGCKSKKCTLPSDYMTRKEIAAMNSDVITCKFDEFYSWEDFKKFKDSTKIDYIEHICSKYSCSISAVSILVFGLGKTGLSNYISSNKLGIKVKKVTGYNAKNGYEALKKAVLAVHGDKSIPVKSTITANIGSATISIDAFDDNVWNALKDIFKDQKVSIMIDVHERYSYETTVGYGFIGNNE